MSENRAAKTAATEQPTVGRIRRMTRLRPVRTMATDLMALIHSVPGNLGLG